ncbi:PREDICTED: uncharacterized protein LOC107169859 [Diuraphis noxia]|uniref:uncharacterized protein LOC107169859 n=1 Tax=Diuraphis noxia TaxID=143948 RepID=UPI000763A04F|nr:PREDICTED: uncharacterized protein LOC107169859 [Diuraphis noxia]
MRSDVKIVHGKPRHSQSQGSVERANRDIEAILAAWMTDNNSKDWPTALKFIQFQKNRALNSGIGRSPYKAMFGCPAKIGLASKNIPYDEISKLKSEEGVENIFKNQNTEELEVEGGGNRDIIDSNKDQINNHRQGVITNLQKQVQKMMKYSNTKLTELQVGTTVRVPIPDVDRARGSPLNLLAVIVSYEADMYTEYGMLKNRFTRAQLVPCPENILNYEKTIATAGVKEITVREAAGYGIAGSQGYTRCNTTNLNGHLKNVHGNILSRKVNAKVCSVERIESQEQNETHRDDPRPSTSKTLAFID